MGGSGGPSPNAPPPSSGPEPTAQQGQPPQAPLGVNNLLEM